MSLAGLVANGHTRWSAHDHSQQRRVSRQQAQGSVSMTDVPAESLASRASRRSILKGLGAAAIGISLSGKTRKAWAAEEPKLNFYNWDTYIGETTLEDFKDASGI